MTEEKKEAAEVAPMLSREDLLAMFKATAVAAPRPVVIPKWGTVYIRDVTLAEVQDQDDDSANGKDKMRLARAVARVLCDKDGALLFDPADPDDVRLLSQQPWKFIQKILEEANAEGK